jgi:transcriptional regulator with XRE-family HTH domain
VRDLLWREAVGHALRLERTAQGRTLADVAGQAGVSTQYLSEVERGRKEPSSEILAAVGTALSLTLLDLTRRVSHSLAPAGARAPQLLAA